jgi:hypothetical protein
MGESRLRIEPRSPRARNNQDCRKHFILSVQQQVEMHPVMGQMHNEEIQLPRRKRGLHGYHCEQYNTGTSMSLAELY